MNVLVIGGAGYVGTSLIPQLLEKNHQVTVFDNLLFGGDVLLPFFRNKNFNFLRGDIRSRMDLGLAVKKQDIIIHLAAIVGYPACRKDPKLAKEVNVTGTKNLVKVISKNQLIIFASTGSGYGYSRAVVTEKTPLNPLSLYGQTKGLAEDILLERGNVIVYRFATAFGVSPRLRLDLLINDFTYKAVTEGYLIVYEKHYKRSFIHVYDMGRAFCFGLDNARRMKDKIYNVGSEKLGYTKEDICQLIKKYTKVYIHYNEIDKDADQRNYEVSYKKVNSLGFKTSIDAEEGIKELISAIKVLSRTTPYSNV